MSRLALAALSLLVTAAHAADDAVSSAPVETVSVVYVIVFGVVFVGMIVGFFAYLWWNETRRKPEDNK